MMTSKSGIPDSFVEAKNALSGFTLLNCRKSTLGNDGMNLPISTNGSWGGGLEFLPVPPSAADRPDSPIMLSLKVSSLHWAGFQKKKFFGRGCGIGIVKSKSPPPHKITLMPGYHTWSISYFKKSISIPFITITYWSFLMLTKYCSLSFSDLSRFELAGGGPECGVCWWAKGMSAALYRHCALSVFYLFPKPSFM